jgi:hypothetical protein
LLADVDPFWLPMTIPPGCDSRGPFRRENERGVQGVVGFIEQSHGGGSVAVGAEGLAEGDAWSGVQKGGREGYEGGAGEIREDQRKACCRRWEPAGTW